MTVSPFRRPAAPRARLMAALAVAVGLAAGPATVVRANEPVGSPISCWTLPWYDFYAWYYGYAGICYFTGGSMWYRSNGEYGTM